jgi:tight adherence protein B
MNRGRRLAAATVVGAVAVLGLLVPAPVARAADEPLAVSGDVTGYPDVRLVVAAPGQAGDEVLTASAFTVREANRVVPVAVEALPAEQLQVALVLDTSGSMSGAPLGAAKAAALSFLSQIPDTVPVSVVGFGARPTVVHPLSSNRSAQRTAISGLNAGGPTALYDALRAGLAQLPAAAGSRRVVVLLSDGGDTSSADALEPTVGALVAAKVPVFAVELRTVESNPAALDRLASATGGQVVAAGDPAALVGAFDAVARQIVRQYALTYRSEARGATDVEVSLAAGAVRATGRARLDLPAPAGTVTARPAPAVATGEVTAPDRPGSWAYALGVGLVGAGLLVLLLVFSTQWAPRARGLVSRRRSLGLSDAADRALSLSESMLRSPGITGRMVRVLEAAGLDIRVGEVLLGMAATCVVVFAAGWVLVSPLVGLVLALIVPALVRVVVGQLATRRRARFGDQLADTLQMLAGSLRAGHSLAQSIDTVARESESPTAEEFRRLTVETRLGRDFVEALAALRDRVGNEDFEWIVQAVEIQREVGGDLAEILDTVTGTIRDRTKVRRQVAALSAEGRLSAIVLVALPLGLGAILAVTNPGYLSPLVKSGTGLAALGVGAALLAVGGAWLRRIVKPIF